MIKDRPMFLEDLEALSIGVFAFTLVNLFFPLLYFGIHYRTRAHRYTVGLVADSCILIIPMGLTVIGWPF